MKKLLIFAVVLAVLGTSVGGLPHLARAGGQSPPAAPVGGPEHLKTLLEDLDDRDDAVRLEAIGCRICEPVNRVGRFRTRPRRPIGPQ